MKTVKITAFAALAFMVSASFGAELVKSKRGDIEITSEKDGGKVICSAGFNDELTIVKKSDTAVLVKGSCGRGWVAKSKIEYVAKGPGDKSFVLDTIGIWSPADNPFLENVLVDNIEDFEGVDINRDFKEYLAYTMDREDTERKNGEN